MQNYPDEFLLFWSAYPRKISKLAAYKAFQRVTRSGVTIEKILAAVENYKAWLGGDGWKPEPKHPTTWLHQGCFDDELENPNDKKPIEFNISAEYVKKLTVCGIKPDAIKRWFDDAVFTDAAIVFKKEFARDYVSRNFDGPLRRAFGFMPELILSGNKPDVVAGERLELSTSNL